MNKVFLLILLFDGVASTKEIISRKRKFADEQLNYEDAVEQDSSHSDKQKRHARETTATKTFSRIPAMGQKVQIGHFFNGHKNEILFAYPRMFNDTDSIKTEIHSKHEFDYSSKDEKIKELMHMDMSASISIKLAMKIPVDIDGYAAFGMNNDATTQTHFMILTLKRETGTEEVNKEAYMGQQEKFMSNPILTAALKNKDEVTHVVTHIEYGSQLFIELEYESSEAEDNMDIEGRLKVAVKLTVAQINAEANATVSTENENFFKKTNIRVHGNLKKTIVALTMFDLIEELKQVANNPDEYLTSAPLFYSVLPLSNFLDRDAVIFTAQLQEEQLNTIYEMRKTFEDRMKNINTLKKFSHDISGANIGGSADLPYVLDNLNAIKHIFKSLFQDLQEEWVEIMERANDISSLKDFSPIVKDQEEKLFNLISEHKPYLSIIENLMELTRKIEIELNNELRNANSSERISVEHKRNEGSLNKIRKDTKFFTLYADDFIQTAENYLKEKKSQFMVETKALDRFHSFMAGDIDFTSDHIEFYLLPHLPKSAVKTGRTLWLNEKLDNGPIISFIGFEKTKVFRKFFEFLNRRVGVESSKIIQLKVEPQLAVNPELPLDAIAKIHMFRELSEMNQFQRYKDQFIDIENKFIESHFENFYKNKLSSHNFHKDIIGVSSIVSDIFITWDDYQQFMDDHPTDFCYVLKHFLDSQEFNKQDNYIINGMLAPMIANDIEWTNWSSDRQEHKIKGLEKDLCNHFYDRTIETKTRNSWSHWSDGCDQNTKSKRTRTIEWKHISFTSIDNEYEERDCGNKESWKLTGVECWDQCGQGGKCSICGESGYCCRNEDDPSWNKGCPTGAIQAALKDRHQCVAPKQGASKQVSRIQIVMDSFHFNTGRKAEVDSCFSGTYSLDSMHNRLEVFKRDERCYIGNQNYLWHHNNNWRLGDEREFNKKDDYYFRKESDEWDVTKLSGLWPGFVAGSVEIKRIN